MPIHVNEKFAKAVERAMSNGNDPIYEYSCRRCGNEFESKDRDLIFCDSAECKGKNAYLYVFLKDQ